MQSRKFSNLLLTETHCFEALGKKMLFIVPTREVYFVDALVYDLFQMLDQDCEVIEARLSQQYTLKDIQEAFGEVEWITDRIEANLNNLSIETYDTAFAPAGMRLNVAHGCNLACVYCYAQQGSYGTNQALMSKEIAKDAIDFLITHGQQAHPDLTFLVEFFGGEPLLNLDVIKYALRYVEMNEYPIAFTITTNGTLITDEVADLFAQYGLGVAITLDGGAEVHNKTRPSRGNIDSHAKVLSGIHKLQERGLHVAVNSILTAISPDYVERYQYLRDMGVTSFRLQPMAPYFENGNLYTHNDAMAMQKLDEYAKYYLHQVSKGNYDFDNYLAPESQIFKDTIRQVLFKSQVVRKLGCAAGCDQVGISPEGNIYPCYMYVGAEEFILGHVSTGIDEQKRKQFLEGAHKRMFEKCTSCWARHQCTGGCFNETYEHALYYPDASPYESQRCIYSKRIIELALAIYTEFEDHPEIMGEVGWTRQLAHLDTIVGQRLWHQDRAEVKCSAC